MSTPALADFWSQARAAVPDLPSSQPEAWAFGATAEHADELLALVLAGVKTGTASSLRDHEVEQDPLPAVGDLAIVLDGAERPQAVIRVSRVDVVPFEEVDDEHAAAEGEGNRTLAHWRRAHEEFWRLHSPAGFSTDMPVVCERFEVLYPASARS